MMYVKYPSHPFGNLLTQYLSRRHGLSQNKLAADINQKPSVISAMCRGERLTGPQARERIMAILAWLLAQEVLDSVEEANALLIAAGMTGLSAHIPIERELIERLRAREQERASHADAIIPARLRVVPAEEGSLPGLPPYKGLHYFEEDDADLFFGREMLTARLVRRLCEHGFLAVVGASGSGKSSIVRAGVIPALRLGEPLANGAPPPSGSWEWEIQLITPTAHPLEELAIHLTLDSDSLSATTALIDDLAREPRSLRLAAQRLLSRPPASGLSAESASRHRPPGGTSATKKRLLLVVDQFEELFTSCHSDTERRAFIDNLTTAISPETDSQVIVLITLRADFYPSCAQFAGLRELLSRYQEFIGPMSAEELRRAIELPARHRGWEIEPGLVDLLVREVSNEPGALPLLSHALLETWIRRRGRTLTLEGYQHSGGVHGAIARTAETVYQERLTPDQRPIARKIFLRLTELGEGTEDTRRRAALSEFTSLAADTSQVTIVLNALADARLLTIEQETVEVAHEALIREWPTLRSWLDEDREALRLHRHLTQAANEWNRRDREPSELYRGARLARALEWAEAHSGEASALEREFLDASRELAERETVEREAQRQRELAAAQDLAKAQQQAARKLRQRAMLLLGMLVLTAFLAGVALMLAQQSAQATRLATSRELASAAVSNLSTDPERSILLALQAISTDDTQEAENALHQAVQSSRVRLVINVPHSPISGTVSSSIAPGLPNPSLDNPVSRVVFSPDGALLAASSKDGTARIWDASSGKLLLTFTGHTDQLWSVAFSPDGSRLATASDDRTAKVWDASSGKLLLTLTGHTAGLHAVTFSPDGSRLATASSDGTAKVWDAASGKLLLTLAGHTDQLWSVAFSPDGARLATASLDRTAKVWDAASGKLLLTLTGHTAGLHAVTFSPDGKRLVTAGEDQTVKGWDAVAGNEVFTLTGPHNIITAIAFSPDGSRLAAASTDQTATVWDASSRQMLFVLAGHSRPVYNLAFSPDGTRLATASADNTVRVWDATPRRETQALLGHTGPVEAVVYSRDGSRLLTASDDGTAKVWDAASGRPLLTLSAGSAPVGGVAWDATATHLATCSQFDLTKLWDARGSGTVIAPQLVITGAVTAIPQYIAGISFAKCGVAFSPDGTRLLAGDFDHTAKVWDVISGRKLLTLTGHSDQVQAVDYSPDGRHLATASLDGTAKVWDASSGSELLTLAGHTNNVSAVAFSPDGTRLATGSLDQTVKVWDIRGTGVLTVPLLTLTGHTGSIGDVVFSPDGTRLAVASNDGTAKIWNAATGQEILTFSTSRGRMLGVAFSPDGTRLATASQDMTVQIYLLHLQDLEALARSRVTRSLTPAECQRYLHMDSCPATP